MKQKCEASEELKKIPGLVRRVRKRYNSLVKAGLIKSKMKIAIIGSTQYKDKFEGHRRKLVAEGHIVRIPAFDDHPELDELGICKFNRDIIRWADEVHLIWDRRSFGTIFDFGMVFMAEKPLRIIYLEPKTFENVMRKYENSQFLGSG